VPVPVFNSEARAYIVDVWSGVAPGVIASYILGSGGEAIVIDPGPASTADFVAGALEQLGLRVRAIIVTHVHLDHAGGAGRLARLFPGARIYVHPRGAPHLVDPSRLWEASVSVMGEMAEVYGKPEPAPRESVVETADGMKLSLPDGRRLTILHTPGHASHHQSVLDETTGTLYTGDSAGVILETALGTVRAPTTPPRLKPKIYLESLDRMISLSPARVAPTHFGIWPNGRAELEAQRELFERWMNHLLGLYKSGVRDPGEAARLLAEKDEEARKLYRSGGLHRTFFLYETVWGMLDAIERGEWP
jgi:glyoxylase-like metal-dependent hydrolase (beta-lactamase superfamily II)